MSEQHPKFIVGALLVVATLAMAVGFQAQNGKSTGPISPLVTVNRDANNSGSEAAGAALYSTYCALCHEGPGADAQAPSREVLKRLSAEQALESLERGSMRVRAATRGKGLAFGRGLLGIGHRRREYIRSQCRFLRR